MKMYELNQIIQNFLKEEIKFYTSNISYQQRIVKRLEIMLNVPIEEYMLEEIRDLKKRLLHCLCHEECLESIEIETAKKVYFELSKIEDNIEDSL